ncbi:MAG: hypothetical protein WDM71_11875 [Ferruginibacter sp.]
MIKKKDITIASYTSGNHISFISTDGANVDADIVKIHDDTLYLRESVVRQVPTTLGVYMLDTTNTYFLQYHYNEIKSIDKTGRHFDIAASGISLLSGGVLLTVASGVVYLADRSHFSSALLIAGATLGVVGYFMSKHNNDGMKIGKKYSLEYVDVSNTPKQ